MVQKAAKKKQRDRQPKKLTPMQRSFALEYIVDLNATRAAIRAGYSERTAAQLAYQLLQNPLVAAEVARLQDEKALRIKMDADRLAMRLFEEADADIADLYEKDGSLKPIHDWPPIWRKGLVTGIEIEEQYDKDDEDAETEFEPQAHGGALKRNIKPRRATGRIAKIKLSDRIKRLDLIGRHINVQAWKERKVIEADEPLRLLAEQIAGNAIRPKEE